MTGSAAGNDGDLWFCGIWPKVDGSTFFVEGGVGVREGDTVEGGEDEVGWVVYEVFGWLNLSILSSASCLRELSQSKYLQDMFGLQDTN